MLYLITGGAGFIGSHLAQRLAGGGSDVRVLDSFETGSRATAEALIREFPGRVTVMEGDIRDRALCRRACEGVDYVLHHAAMASVPRSVDDPEECAAVNIGGTATVLAAAQASGSVRRVVFASSSAVYGDLPGERKREDDALDPASPYASSKYAGELFCRNYTRLLGLETVAFRYFNVYGPRQSPDGAYAAVIPKFVDALRAGRPPAIYGDGRQTRDFVYIDDVVEANLLGCSCEAASVSGRAFNIAGGAGITLNRLIDELSYLTGTATAARYEPPRPGDIVRSVADISLARQVLGYAPAVGIADGLRRLLSSEG